MSNLIQVKLSYKIDVHDYEVRKRAAMRFLLKGDKVKATIRYVVHWHRLICVHAYMYETCFLFKGDKVQATSRSVIHQHGLICVHVYMHTYVQYAVVRFCRPITSSCGLYGHVHHCEFHYISAYVFFITDIQHGDMRTKITILQQTSADSAAGRHHTVSHACFDTYKTRQHDR